MLRTHNTNCSFHKQYALKVLHKYTYIHVHMLKPSENHTISLGRWTARQAIKRTFSYFTCRVTPGEEIRKNKKTSHYPKFQVSHSLLPCPLYFTRRCYWKSSVAKGLCSIKIFFVFSGAWQSCCTMMEQKQPEGFLYCLDTWCWHINLFLGLELPLSQLML